MGEGWEVGEGWEGGRGGNWRPCIFLYPRNMRYDGGWSFYFIFTAVFTKFGITFYYLFGATPDPRVPLCLSLSLCLSCFCSTSLFVCLVLSVLSNLVFPVFFFYSVLQLCACCLFRHT